MLAVIRFRIGGSLRFLSHAETMRLFQRACVRAGVKVAYSQGYNPHQRMSLVLPRSVGVESDDELLCLWLAEGQTAIDAEALKDELSAFGETSPVPKGRGGPAGIEIISVETSEAKNIPEPISARYIIKVQGIGDGVRKRIVDVLASDKVVVNRRTGKDSRTKPVDVRPFLGTIKAEQSQVTVDCKISQAGTIRVDEILNLLGLAVEDLARPVIRTTVQYSECKMQN